MKVITFITFPFLVLIACGQTSQAPSTSSSPEATTITKPVTSNFNKKEACEYVSPEELAQIMGWEASNIISKLSMSIKDRDVTVCNIIYGDESMLFRLAWKSERSQENKVLERNFNKQLTTGEGDLKYRELSNTTEGQVIWGVGPGRVGQHVYILRKRIGNEIEIQLEALSMINDEAAFLGKLKNILGKIEG